MTNRDAIAGFEHFKVVDITGVDHEQNHPGIAGVHLDCSDRHSNVQGGTFTDLPLLVATHGC